MKQKIYNILLLFVATTIFFVGAGVTIVNFCCSDCVANIFSHGGSDNLCKMEKMEVEDHSCCSDEQQTDNHFVFSDKSHTECCDAERISYDIDHRFYKPDISNHLLSAFSIISTYCFIANTDHYLSSYDSFFEISNTIPISPREYLSRIRVLII